MGWLAAIVFLASMTLARAADPQPRLQVERPVFDFGEVEQGQTVEHVFKLRNGGEAPLRVHDVKSTCACTVGAVLGRDVAAGDETWVTVQLDTRDLAGSTTKTITVYTNDPEHPASGLSLRGTVVTDLVVDPPLVYLGTVEQGAAGRRTVHLRPGRPTTTVRATVVRAPAFLRARVVDDSAGQELEIGLAPDAPVGRLQGDVVLATTSESRREIVVPVFGTVRASADSS